MSEEDETWHVLQALQKLVWKDKMWESNLRMFERMDPVKRILWWRRAKQQAVLGAPAMQTLRLKVIELRILE